MKLISAGKCGPVEESACSVAGSAKRGIGSRSGSASPPSPASSRLPLKGLTEARVRYSSDAGTRPVANRADAPVDDDGKTVPSSAEARIYVVGEDELTEEIRSEISTHEQEIEALRNEMALLRNRRLLTAKAWAWTSLEQPHAARSSASMSEHMRASNEDHTDIHPHPCTSHLTPGVSYLDEGAESEDDSESAHVVTKGRAQGRSHGFAEGDMAGEKGCAEGDRAGEIEIERLRCDLETLRISLREKDRERQIEVEKQVERWRSEASASLGIAEQLRALVVEREQHVLDKQELLQDTQDKLQEKDERLQQVRAELKQAKKHCKFLMKENRELEADRNVALLKVQRLEVDVKEHKRVAKGGAERNELLTKQLQAEKRLRKREGGRREEEEEVGGSGGERVGAIEGGGVSVSVVKKSHVSPENSYVSAAEESDAIRGLQAQLDSLSRHWASERGKLTSEAASRQDTLVNALEAADVQAQSAREKSRNLREHAKVGLSQVRDQLASLHTELRSVTSVLMNPPPHVSNHTSEVKASDHAASSASTSTTSSLREDSGHPTFTRVSSSISSDARRRGGGGGGEEDFKVAMREMIEKLAAEREKFAGERDESVRLAVLFEAEVVQLRELLLTQQDVLTRAQWSDQEEKRRRNVERQLAAAKEALRLCQAELDSVQEELYAAQALVRLGSIPEEEESKTQQQDALHAAKTNQFLAQRAGEEQATTGGQVGSALSLDEVVKANRQLIVLKHDLKCEVLGAAKNAAARRSELDCLAADCLAAENSKLLGLTGSPTGDCSSDPRCERGGERGRDADRETESATSERRKLGGWGDRPKLVMGSEVVSPKRGVAGQLSGSQLDTIQKNAALEEQLAQARSEICRLEEEVDVLRYMCAQALESAQRERETHRQPGREIDRANVGEDFHTAEILVMQLFERVAELEGVHENLRRRVSSSLVCLTCPRSMQATALIFAADINGARCDEHTPNMSLDSLVAGRGGGSAHCTPKVNSREYTRASAHIQRMDAEKCEYSDLSSLRAENAMLQQECRVARQHEAELKGQYSAVSTELVRVQKQMSRMLSSITPANCTPTGWRGEKREGEKRGGRECKSDSGALSELCSLAPPAPRRLPRNGARSEEGAASPRAQGGGGELLDGLEHAHEWVRRESCSAPTSSCNSWGESRDSQDSQD